MSPRPARRPRRSELPPAFPTVGIIGGGQLARMLALAAAPLGCRIAIHEASQEAPAAGLAHKFIPASADAEAGLRLLGSVADVVTLENEFVDSKLLSGLEQAGHQVYPPSKTVGVVQDKLLQKERLKEAGLPVPPFRAVTSPAEIREAGRLFGWPLVLKQRRNGYDGKGNYTIRSSRFVQAAWDRMGAGKTPLFVEGFCEFTSELATIITRGLNGQAVQYPLVETVQKNHICHEVIAPAPVDSALAERALSIASRAVEAVQGVGSFGVEMFLTESGVLVNELAPRVHNSGHYTIEACVCSQFENHIRAVLGWPLGPATLVAPAAAMVNLLGHSEGPGAPRGLEKALAIPGAYIHLYGKTRSAPSRKMGHVTALGASGAEALAIARRAANLLRFGSKS